MQTKPAITQHYWNRYRVEPICPAHKPRYNGDAEQAEYLRQWTEKRRRRQRLQVVPRTEVTEEEHKQRIERAMYLVGLPCSVLALALTIFLLIVHFGFWTIPALLSAWGLHRVWRRWE